MNQSIGNVEDFSNVTYDDVIESRIQGEEAEIGKSDVEGTTDSQFDSGALSKNDISTKIKDWEDGIKIPLDEEECFERRPRRGTNKELWVPPKTQISSKEDGHDRVSSEDAESDPVKPPRKPNQLKTSKRTNSEKEKERSAVNLSEEYGSLTPVKPPRRKEKVVGTHHGASTTSADHVFSASGEPEDVGFIDRDIVCKPVLTSSPNQDELSLSVDSVDGFDRSHHVLTYCDTETAGVKTVESFYDYLWSDQGKEFPSAGVNLDPTYDDVPLENTLASSNASIRSGYGTGIYDEVIVNQESYLMPANEEDSDEFSESDPWGSDFDTDDDIDRESRSMVSHDDEDSEDPYDSVEITPLSHRKRQFKFVGDSAHMPQIFSGGWKPNLAIPGLKGQLKGCFGINRAPSLPYLAKGKKEEVEGAYVEPDITDAVSYTQAVMPPMTAGTSNEQVKRYQIIKFILESEAEYMRLLDLLIKSYEVPVRERDLLEPSKIDVIFQPVHKVLQCHVMFNVALSGRMSEWEPQEGKIGDILYALFSKSMVLDAYSRYVNNFTRAMDTVKMACRTHLAFAQFLKAKRQLNHERRSLHHLMLKPTQRFPQLTALLQELLVSTPLQHSDRVPLQLALTQLECLAENLSERKREAELKNKVKLLDACTAQLNKPLATGARYFIRQDDYVQCTIEGDAIIKTKKRRVIMLSDMLLCVSSVKGKRDRLSHMITQSKAKYKLKWNVPLSDVEIVEYGTGVNVLANTYRTTITHAKEGQYRKGYSGCQEHFEDLQHDLAVIGQIAGLTATLRRSYQVLDSEKVQRWHKAVQRTIEEESRLANIYWLELSLPSKNGRVHYIFSTESTTAKAEWVAALNTAKRRLDPENNPGWYLPEDDGTGGVSIQRRNMPLLKDNTGLFLLTQETTVIGMVSIPDLSDPLPGVHDNYNMLWLLCGGGDNVGLVGVVKTSLASAPQILESFHVCDSHIMCGEYVPRTTGDDGKFRAPFTGRFGFPFPTVWLGTQSGRIYIYNAVDSERRYVMSVKLPDAVLCLKVVDTKVFAGVADGSLIVFKPNEEMVWNFTQPKATSLSNSPVMAITQVGKTLWCASGNKIYIIDANEETTQHVIEVDSNPKTCVKHVLNCGVGVWVSLWKMPTLMLFHSETHQHMQDISIASPVQKMQNDIDSQLAKTKLDKVYVTSMTAAEGILWVGTSVGVILILPLPRLEGVPLVSGRACVAFHAYNGRVRCMYPLVNNPNVRVADIYGGKKPFYQLFRAHEMRDACVQTDDAICSTAGSYADTGPALAARNKASSKKDRPIPTRPGDGNGYSNDEEEDEIHSDDEFNFIEDTQDRPAPTMSPEKQPVASFAVTIDGQHPLNTSMKSESGSSSPSNQPSSSNQAEGIGEDDFVKMMSDFKGFGSASSRNIPPPPPPKPVPSLKLGASGSDVGGSDVGGSDVGGNEVSTAEKTGSGEGTTGNSTTNDPDDGNMTGASSGNDVSAKNGTYLGINESRHPNKYQGLVQNGKSPVVKSSAALAISASSTPEYVTLTNSVEREPQTPDSDDTSIIRDDSFSVFTPRASREPGQVTQQSSQTGAVAKEQPKLENLKPRLRFPVLLVTAGEGHADLRRKVPDGNDKEPRIMIWQMS